MSDDCLFCRIVAGEVPADVVAKTDAVLAFRDVNPQAPLHVLVIPRVHIANAAERRTNSRLKQRLREADPA